jgi:spore coat polysaccharide biosynthesis protein SpsF
MIVAVLQARMSSSRLPGKVLADLCGEPMIVRQLERIRRARTLTKVVVATSRELSDAPLARTLTERGWPVYRGELNDVLGRVCSAVRWSTAAGSCTHVVRLTADCPLADPEVIDEAVRLALASRAAYTSNCERRTYPDGLDVEVVEAGALFTAADRAATPYDREHVTPYVRSRPALYPQAHLSQPQDRSALRWTVDRPEDLAFVRSVYEALHPGRPAFTSQDVYDLIERRPEFAAAA